MYENINFYYSRTMEISNLTYCKFMKLSEFEQYVRLQGNLRYLVTNQEQVEMKLTMKRSDKEMDLPFNDAFRLNQTVRKHLQIHVDPNISFKYPGFVKKFTWDKLDTLCTDTKQLLKQLFAFKKPQHIIITLMCAAREIEDEQQQIIKKYSKQD